MDTTIENKFFAEFQNGAAEMCLKYTKRVIVNKKEKLNEWESKCYSAFPAEVAARTDSFDDIAWPVNVVGEYRIGQEISDNLDNLANDKVIERYIISILEVFEDWTNIFTPIATLRMLNNMMKNAHNDKEIYTTDEIQQEIDRVSNLHDDYLDIMRGAKEGSMEYYFSHWYRAYYMFAQMFAAICTEHQINLLEIQAKRGIWLVEKLDVMKIQGYFGCNGDFTYANAILKSLPRTDATEALILTEKDGVINSEAVWNSNNYEPQQKELKDLFPEELKVDDAVKVFQKAIEARLIIYSTEGLKWNDTKQLLAYFATKVSDKFNLTTKLDKDGNKTTAWKPFENLFKVQALKAAKQNWMRLNTKFEPTGFEKVDALF